MAYKTQKGKKKYVYIGIDKGIKYPLKKWNKLSGKRKYWVNLWFGKFTKKEWEEYKKNEPARKKQQLEEEMWASAGGGGGGGF